MSTSVIGSDEFPGGKAAAAILRGAGSPPRAPGLAEAVPRSPRREYLKALRGAELAAWKSRGGRIGTAVDSVRRARVELERQRRSEAWLFTVVGSITALALVLGFRDSLDITQRWADFARFVAQLLG